MVFRKDGHLAFVCFVLVVCVLLLIFILLFCCYFCCCCSCLVCLFVCCLFACFNFVVVVEIIDAKLNPMLAYASEIWETVRLDNIEKVPMMPCMRFFGVPLGTPIKMVYDELGRCSIFVTNTLRCLKHCLF